MILLVFHYYNAYSVRSFIYNFTIQEKFVYNNNFFLRICTSILYSLIGKVRPETRLIESYSFVTAILGYLSLGSEFANGI